MQETHNQHHKVGLQGPRVSTRGQGVGLKSSRGPRGRPTKKAPKRKEKNAK